MNCNEARRHWNLYHDSEGDAELHFQINEHLAICPDCAQWFSQQSRLESLLAEKLGAQPPTPELWSQVLERSGLVRPAPARRWLGLLALAACTLLIGLGTIGYAVWRASKDHTLAGPSTSPRLHDAADLAKLTAARHERLADKRDQAEFQSENDLEIEKYLRQRVAFPVRCPPRKDAGFAVQGAGVCELAQQQTAYLLGEVDNTPVSIFILPRDSLQAFPHQLEIVQREKRHRCREGAYEMVMGGIDRNVVLVVGQAKPEQLERVLNAYGTYPEHPG